VRARRRAAARRQRHRRRRARHERRERADLFGAIRAIRAVGAAGVARARVARAAAAAAGRAHGCAVARGRGAVGLGDGPCACGKSGGEGRWVGRRGDTPAAPSAFGLQWLSTALLQAALSQSSPSPSPSPSWCQAPDDMRRPRRLPLEDPPAASSLSPCWDAPSPPAAPAPAPAPVVSSSESRESGSCLGTRLARVATQRCSSRSESAANMYARAGALMTNEWRRAPAAATTAGERGGGNTTSCGGWVGWGGWG